ncbi:MAG: ribonuclease E/G [Erythrobacter sp.]|nr:ribonuclease E/G [Erythrobacter sp.]
MAEWLIEEGIGETRALLVEGEEILAARLFWPGELRAGERCKARLTAKLAGTRRGVVQLDNGSEALVDHLPPAVTEGQMIDLTITRAALAERGRLKRAQARVVVADAPAGPPASMVDGRTVHRFPSGLWDEVWHAASSASCDFSGGEILISVTPAMTVIDVDGVGSPRDVALTAVPTIARALRWFDLGGNIGIDFPTLAAKADRRAVDEALGAALADWPHERTAMNGFGFVQLVARLEGPSLLHRFATARLGASTRIALRRAELAADGGAGRTLLLTVHPALKAKLKPEWLTELARRTGREVRIETDPGLAIEGAHAQLLTT